MLVRSQESRHQFRALRAFLGVSDGPDEQYDKVDGSCEWLEARDDFCEWRGLQFEGAAAAETPAHNNTVSVYWVHANPGTGKSVLASHVVSRLQELQLECAYHYFHAGAKTSASLGRCLRSIAYQMAVSNAAICSKLSQLVQDGQSLDMDDARIIWTTVFKKGIFQAGRFAPFPVASADHRMCQVSRLYTTILGH